jgi:hypothetical protein
MERRFKKVKNSLMILRDELAEARKYNHEQNDRLHKIDLVMENIVNNFLDASSM